ncbi:MAG: cell division/cell wall cluster transcriptional repressor MraZ [Gammaproteobacteria bacterium]|mgnify:FL=1|nr:cell division/cell wall cluster transcriptional repressor MraZ [Gammaproteobacteria bacterium]OUU10651.1 MAG: cell division/cell wall cluster transcriptional repressor MraZ [Gammaproteobacteria bacterium TMED34]|tara:strand:+ start:140 stop:601 length:462 start_codon:yes stop_codon:yes gene_type:complete
MFRGVSYVTIDAKGRMSVPVRYREQLSQLCNGEVVVTIDSEENCLMLYPLPVWNDVERKIEALPTFNKAARRIQRLLIGHATDIQMDGTGRLLLPAPLREYALMEKKLVLLGQINKIEIWSESHWLSRREQLIAVKDESSEGDQPDFLETLSL